MRELSIDEVSAVGGGMIGAADGDFLCGISPMTVGRYIFSFFLTKAADAVFDATVSSIKNTERGGTPNGTDALGNNY